MRYWPLIFCLFAAACLPPPLSRPPYLDGGGYGSLVEQSPGSRVVDGSLGIPSGRIGKVADDSAERQETAITSAIRLSPAEHDFGVVKAGEELKLTLDVIRPEGTPLRLGRVMASCTCVTVSAPKRAFPADDNEPGKTYVLLKTDKLNGANSFSVSVELLEPERTVLQSNLSLTVRE